MGGKKLSIYFKIALLGHNSAEISAEIELNGLFAWIGNEKIPF